MSTIFHILFQVMEAQGSEEPAKGREKRKRQLVRVACNPCRVRRMGCDGARPACSSCTRRNPPDSCSYDTTSDGESRFEAVKRQKESADRRYQELETCVKLSRELPDDKALEVLRRLGSEEPREVLESLASTIPVARAVSPHPSARALLPPTSTRLEYELVVTNGYAYPAAVPLVPLSRLGGLEAALDGETARTTSGSSSSSATLNLPYELLVGPLEAQKLCDARLHLLRIGKWTSIPVADNLAARMVSYYLETLHTYFAFFDADLFVRDLVNFRRICCSELLLYAVLFAASVAFADPDASALTVPLRNEIDLLWASTYNTDSVQTAAATIIVGIVLMWLGENDAAFQYVNASRAMATRLGLFGEMRTVLQPQTPQFSDHWRSAAFTAWGMFGWLNLCVAFYHNDVPPQPPLYPIPGDPDLAHSVPGFHQLPSHMATTVPLMSKLWIIASEFLLLYHADFDTPVKERIPIAFAEAVYQRLLLWAKTLPDSVAEGKPQFHHQAILHIYFHILVIELFLPYVESDEQELRTFSYPESNARAASQASLSQLKRYVADYHYMYGAFYNDMFWIPASTYVASAMIADPDQLWRRRYLYACIAEHLRLSLCYPLAAVLLEGLLAMATRQNVVRSEQAKRILERAAALQRLKGFRLGASISHPIVLDRRLAVTDHASARVDRLAENLRDIFLYDEFVEHSPPPQNGG